LLEGKVHHASQEISDPQLSIISLQVASYYSIFVAATTENRGALMSVNGMTLRAGQTPGPLLMAAILAVFTFLLVR